MDIEHNVPLAERSAFGIGRKARHFCLVRDKKEFLEALAWAQKRNIRWKVCGDASNIVFPDHTLPYLLICFGGGGISVRNQLILADAGVHLSDVIAQSFAASLGGLETLSGIPGTIGGAIVGNAGAYGHSISEAVRVVEIFDAAKNICRWITADECEFAYRESVFKHKPYIVLCAVLEFEYRNRASVVAVARHTLKMRRAKYNPDLQCPGSFFKNVLVSDVPKESKKLINRTKIIKGKIPAGYLLEAVGAKGMRAGDIEISASHGNLMVNRGGGTAADVKKLAQKLKRLVYKKFGIALEEEVRYF